MTKITDNLNLFKKLKEEIGAYFGTSIYEGFDDMRYVKCWSLNSEEIRWNESEDSEEPEEYGGEIYGTCVWEKEEYTLICYDNGSGEKIYAIFDNLTRKK